MPNKILSTPVAATTSTSHKRHSSTARKAARRKAQRKISPKGHHSVFSPTTSPTSNMSAGKAGTNQDVWKKKRKKGWHDAPAEVVQAAEAVAVQYRAFWFMLTVRGFPIAEHDKLVNTIRTAFKRAYPGKPFFAQWTSVPANARTGVREHAHISVALPDRGIMDVTRARLRKCGYVTDLGDHYSSPGAIKGQFGYHEANRVKDKGTSHRSQDFRRAIRTGTISAPAVYTPVSDAEADELQKKLMALVGDSHDALVRQGELVRHDAQEPAEDIQAPSPTPEAQTESTAPEIATNAVVLQPLPVPATEDDLRRRLMAMLSLDPDQDSREDPATLVGRKD